MATILVTGASRGLGLEFVRQFAGKGHFVYAACRQPAQAEGLRSLLAERMDTISVLPLDVEDDASIAAAVAQVNKSTPKLSLLINNAGTGSANKGLSQLNRSEFRRVLETNTIGPALVTKAFLPLLESARGALVVNISSVLGSVGSWGGGDWCSYPYNVSKSGLNMISKMLALELAPQKVGVLNLHPGWVRTDMGGKEAPLSSTESVAKMLQVIASYQPRLSGKYLDLEGQELPW
jgi:NAD(P)-dependent dehydrogenase (short-subunit alcohol dehydrogenase family)